MRNSLAEFRNNLSVEGLEYYNKFYGEYKGFCSDVNDPENRFRIQVAVPQVYGLATPNIWALPKGVSKNDINPPVKGDPVWVSFENGDVRFPIWSYGWLRDNDLPEKAKDTGIVNSTKQYGGNTIEFKLDGTLIITNKNGHQISLLEDKISVSCGASKIEVQDGKVILDGDTYKAVLGDKLNDFLDSLLDSLSSATTIPAVVGVPLSFGPSVIADLIAKKAELPTLLSSKVTLD